MRRATWILILAVVVLNVASLAYAIPMADFIRYRSTSVTTDLWLRFAYFALMLITAFVEALCFDELRYRGGWRKRFLGGRQAVLRRQRGQAAWDAPEVESGAGEDSGDLDAPAVPIAQEGEWEGEPQASNASRERDFEEEQALAEALSQKRGGLRALLAENSVPFFLAVFLCLGANFVLFNAVTGWFDFQYGRTGHLMTQLRSPDAKKREQAILGLAPHRGETIELRIVGRLETGTEGEKRWAAWALGLRRHIRLPPVSEATLDRGEAALLVVLHSGAPASQGAAAVALARTAERRGPRVGANVLPALRAHLERERESGQVGLETLVALGIIREKAAVKTIGALLTDSDEARALAAAWALGRMQHPSAVEPMLRALSEEKPRPASPPVRCAVVEALGHLGSAARVSKALMDEFNRKSSDFRCNPRSHVLRPDGRGKRVHDRLHFVGSAELYRNTLLKVLGRVGFLDDALPWLKGIADPRSPYPPEVRSYAGELYRSLERQIARDR